LRHTAATRSFSEILFPLNFHIIEKVYKVKTTTVESTTKTPRIVQAEILEVPSLLIPSVACKIRVMLKERIAQTRRVGGRLSNTE
jgi:hypothetical protein